MKASILINNHNYDRFLAEAVRSALSQTFPGVEVIVVDDGSTDNSRKILGEFGSDVIPVFSENLGQNSAVNLGVAASSGDVLFFLDSDDYFDPRRVERVMNRSYGFQLDAHPAIIYSTMQRVDATGRRIYDNRRESLVRPRRYVARFLRHKVLCTPDHSVPLYRDGRHEVAMSNYPPSTIAMTKSLASKMFPLPVGRTKAFSDIYINRAARLISPVVKIPDCLTYYRMHGGNFSMNVANKSLPPEIDADVVAYMDSLLLQI